MKKDTMNKIISISALVSKVVLVVGGVYVISKVIDQRDVYKALYERECSVYVDLARKVGIAQSGDHTSIAKTIFKDGTEFLAEQATDVVLAGNGV